MRMLRTLSLVAVSALLAGCVTTHNGPEVSSSSGDASDPSAAASPTTLRVLAGSEVKDMEPILAEAAKATGVTVKLGYAGTIDASDQVAGGQAASSYDATWFSSNRYLSLVPGGTKAVTSPTKIMASPVILGVKQSKAHELGWDTKAPTWAEISAAVQAKKLTYGMTNPASSNSGFSALVGVATALAGGGSALDAARIQAVKPQLTQFFSGQKLTSGSSGWLADRFKADQSVDGIINYESVLLGLDAAGGLPEKLTLVYPRDGVVSADYPLSLLASASAKSAAFQKLTDWLRSPEAQQKIMAQTHRRPVVPGVKLASEFGNHLLVELPFPAQRSAADGLISTYLDEARPPSQTIYVLDTSGSMDGSRLDALKKAFTTLSKGTGTEAFTRFHRRERVTVETFSDEVRPPTVFDIPDAAPDAELAKIDDSVQALDAGGGTAMYSALAQAYQTAATQVKERPGSITSIVLMTDGESNMGLDAKGFRAAYDGLDAATKKVPTFAVLFGESKPEDLQQIAQQTGGKVFDGRTASLSTVFKEIRGYQ